MHKVDPASLIVLSVAIALAGAIPALLPWLPIPGVVLEIAFGAALGPQGLNVGHVGPVLEVLADLGLAVLFLMAGFEVDPRVLKGRPLRNAALGWLISVAVALLATLALTAAGLATSPVLTALAFSTTAIGTLLPILRDQGLLEAPYGPMLLAAGALGEAAPIVGLSLVLAGLQHLAWQTMVLAGFALTAALAVMLAGRTRKAGFGKLAARTMHMSGQFPVRAAIAVMMTLVVLSQQFEIDLVLGAFVAGAVARAALPYDLHPALVARLDGIGYGFLVPLFFVASGMRLDVKAVFGSPANLLVILLFAAIMLAARGLPAFLLYRADLSPQRRRALALHSGTQLPLVVAIASIGVQRGYIAGSQAAAMVGAGILTVVLFPALARIFLKDDSQAPR